MEEHLATSSSLTATWETAKQSGMHVAMQCHLTRSVQVLVLLLWLEGGGESLTPGVEPVFVIMLERHAAQSQPLFGEKMATVLT